ncbi:hypothetical protein ESCOMMO078M1_03060 [Escherichia coli]
MGKELDDICTSCPYIDTVKRHKQQLGAIEEYTQWLKKEPRASYFFLFQLYTRIHNTFFSQKQQLPFTPGGTHCPEPDVTLRDLTLSPGYHSDYAPQPIPEMDSSAVVPPTNENTSPPEDTPDNTPAGGNNRAEMSPEAAGIAACLMTYSHHACRTENYAMTVHYYRLRDYALQHPECSAIMRIID